MKKILALPLITVLCTSALCACGKNNGSFLTDLPNDTQITSPAPRAEQSETGKKDENGVKIRIDGEFSQDMTFPPLPGVSRFARRTRAGVYTVEYVHYPYGEKRDTSLDYTLTLNADNTFDMRVVTNGTSAEHAGRWYENKSEVMLFYDEAPAELPHNAYACDCLFGEVLPGGKLMFFENGNTIVLSRKNSDKRYSAHKSAIKIQTTAE